MKYYLAIDIGASSGRHIVGWKENGALRTEEVFRFPNGVQEEDGHLVWDIRALYENVKAGIRAAFQKCPTIESLAIDSWGVDYVLTKGEEEILPVYAYRDGRTEEAIGKVHAAVPFPLLYERTGIQFQPFNTVYQFFADMQSGRLQRADGFLMIPEYLSYKLTGVRLHEYTNATTTGLVNAGTRQYDGKIISGLGLPEKLFGGLTAPGSAVGALLPSVAEEVGGNTQVVLCASHDTASAVEGIPMAENTPYISSGTWSLLGVKSPHAICTEESRRANWSNEGGVGYYRFQKNIMGMWLVQSLKKELCPGKSFDEIVREARGSGFSGIVDADDARFLAPKSMKSAFDSCFGDGGPFSEGDYFRCAYHSLARSYQKAVSELERCTDRSYRSLYIVGGGAKNDYLNELTQAACGMEVIALPVEATALGNLKIQMNRGKI